MPKTNAENMLPKVWSDANNKDDTSTANRGGMINCNLFKKTPLNSNSSTIGETIMVAIKLVVKNECDAKFKDDTLLKIKSEKYSIPYEKNMFKITIANTVLIIFKEKTSRTSFLAEGNSSLSLKIK